MTVRKKISFPAMSTPPKEGSVGTNFKLDVGFLPTGSTLLNLALSENPFGGWRRGKIINIVGDTHAGKTFLYWQTLAELCNSPKHSKLYDMYYDDTEEALEFKVKKLFGEKTHNKVIFDDKWDSSEYIEEALERVDKLLDDGNPFVYAIDSVDALESLAELERKKKKGKGVADQDYPQKSRVVNELFKRTKKKLKVTNSTLFMISQTRDKIGVTFGSKKRRVCEKPLDFFSTYILWLAVVGPVKRKETHVGNVIRVRITKNKWTGKKREVEFPIYADYGIADVESMVDWMVKEDFWEKKKQTICAGSDFIDATKSKLIDHIFDNSYEDDLRQIVGECWMKLDEETRTSWKPRYA